MTPFNIITAGNEEYQFHSSDINDKFLRHFIKQGEAVYFWGKYHIARNISTLFGVKFKKLSRMMFYGQVCESRVYFQVYNYHYSLYIPNCKFKNNDTIGFYLKSKKDLLFVKDPRVRNDLRICLC